MTNRNVPGHPYGDDAPNEKFGRSRNRHISTDVKKSERQRQPDDSKHRERKRQGSDKLRRQICFEAARLMYSRQESEYYRAKMKAARKICMGWVKPADLPSNAEIRDELQRFAFSFEGESRFDNLREMRIEALRMLRMLQEFRPRIIGSVFTGHIRRGSDIDLHVFSSSLNAVTITLDYAGLEYDVERKQVRKDGEEKVYTHVHIRDRFPIELTIYSPEYSSYGFKSSITGKAIERASLSEYETFLQTEYPNLDLSAALQSVEQKLDRFQVFSSLMLPLGQLKQSRKWHPEGDVLYHSLQVFDLALDERPYDEEFLLAALLHDVGKGIDPQDHVNAGLTAIGEYITERTAWLIKHHMDAHRYRDRTLGARAKRRLAASEHFEDLMLLEECDRLGRQVGVDVPDLEDAFDIIRELERM